MGLTCAREQEIREAAATDRWSASADAHSRDCARCAEVRLVVRALQSPVTGAPRALDPALLWARARQERRLRADAQISRVVTASQLVVATVVIAVMLVFVEWPASWPWLSIGLDDRSLLYGITGLLMVAAVAWSQRLTRDHWRSF